MVSLFIRCHCMCTCICSIHIPKNKLLCLYYDSFMYVFRAGYLIMNNELLFSFRKKTFSPNFCILFLPVVLFESLGRYEQLVPSTLTCLLLSLLSSYLFSHVRENLWVVDLLTLEGDRHNLIANSVSLWLSQSPNLISHNVPSALDAGVVLLIYPLEFGFTILQFNWLWFSVRISVYCKVPLMWNYNYLWVKVKYLECC